MKQLNTVRILFGTSLILSVCLVSSALSLSHTFERWKRLHRSVLLARQEIAKAETIKRELLRRQRLIDRVENFIRRAHELGLSPEHWDQYDVELEESVSFPQLAEILKQTASGNNYYFEPIFLYLSRAKPNEQGEGPTPVPGQERPPNAEGGKSKDGDMYLRVKGSFLVRK